MQRANYIHWVEDLLAGPVKCAIQPPGALQIPPSIKGLDIGMHTLFRYIPRRVNTHWYVANVSLEAAAPAAHC